MVLAALEAMDADAFVPRAACDMGCGSGILSLAIARKFQCPVVAVDVLRESIEATRANAAENGIALLPPTKIVEGTILAPPQGGSIYVIHSDGFRHPDIKAHAPFDLMVMNILAEPLLALAADASANLATEGVLILSGIFLWQEAQITQAYTGLGFERTTRLVSGDWVALGFQKPQSE
jgi:ribosomal protein L11 methyltransferase